MKLLALVKAAQQATKAMIRFERQLRMVSLSMPVTMPWPFNTWWGPRLHPLQAALTMEFAVIEMERQGIYLKGGHWRGDEDKWL